MKFLPEIDMLPNERWVRSSTDSNYAVCLDRHDKHGRYGNLCFLSGCTWVTAKVLTGDELMHLSTLHDFKVNATTTARAMQAAVTRGAPRYGL